MYSCRCRFMSLFAVASSICAGGDSPSHRKKTTEEENFSTGLRRVSDLYLVNGLLVFLLSRLEEALGVVNHLLQAVLLIDGRRNNKLEIRTLCLNANNSHTAGQLMELSESRLVLFSHPVRISLTGAALLALADGTEPHTHTHTASRRQQTHPHTGNKHAARGECLKTILESRAYLSRRVDGVGGKSATWKVLPKEQRLLSLLPG